MSTGSTGKFQHEHVEVARSFASALPKFAMNPAHHTGKTQVAYLRATRESDASLTSGKYLVYEKGDYIMISYRQIDSTSEWFTGSNMRTRATGKFKRSDVETVNTLSSGMSRFFNVDMPKRPSTGSPRKKRRNKLIYTSADDSFVCLNRRTKHEQRNTRWELQQRGLARQDSQGNSKLFDLEVEIKDFVQAPAGFNANERAPSGFNVSALKPTSKGKSAFLSASPKKRPEVWDMPVGLGDFVNFTDDGNPNFDYGDRVKPLARTNHKPIVRARLEFAQELDMRIEEAKDTESKKEPQSKDDKGRESIEIADALEKERADAGIKIQTIQRGKAARREYHRQKNAGIKIQTIQRGKAARREYHRQKNAGIKIQTIQRGKAARHEYHRQKNAGVIKIQTIQRGKAARREYHWQKNMPQW